MLSSGSSVNLCSNDEESPVLIASLNGHTHIAELLLNVGAEGEMDSVHSGILAKTTLKTKHFY